MIVITAPAAVTQIKQGCPGGSLVPGANSVCQGVKQIVGGTVGSAASAVSNDALQSFAKDFASTISHVLKLLATAWVSIPSPFTSSSGGAAQDGTTSWLGGELRWVVGAILILGIMFGAIVAIWNAGRGRSSGEDVDRLSTALLRTILVSAGGVAFIGVFMVIAQQFSTWILGQAGTSWSGGNSVDFTSVATTDPGLVIVLGILVAIAGLVQIFVVAGIAVVLPILAALWPASAAASVTESGNGVWKKHTAWIAAAVLFKPTAAVIYAAAFKMIQAKPSCPAGQTCDAQSVSDLSLIFGLLLLILAVFALPALMRLLVPAVAAVGGISGGEAIGAGVSLATGAAMIAATGGAGVAAGAGGAAGTSAGAGAGEVGAGATGPPGPGPGGPGSGPGGGDGGGTPPPASGADGAPGGNDGDNGGGDGPADFGGNGGGSGARHLVGAQVAGNAADEGSSLAEGAVPIEEGAS